MLGDDIISTLNCISYLVVLLVSVLILISIIRLYRKKSKYTKKTIIAGVILIFILIIGASQIGDKGPCCPERYGPYEVNINREFNNQTEKDIILFVENLSNDNMNLWEDDFHYPKKGNYICAESINYYKDVVETFEQNHSSTDAVVKHAGMAYRASIAYIENNGTYNTTDNNLIEVYLELEYSHYVGPLCGLGYGWYRRVILTNNMTVIKIEGDGSCMKWIA